MTRRARERLHWGVSLALALAAHAVLLGAVLWLPVAQPILAADETFNAVMVELAATPTAPPAAPTELPPGPPQQARQAQPAPKPPEPRPEPPAEPAPVVPVADLADPAPQTAKEPETASSREQAAIARTTAPPSVDAASGTEYAASANVSGQAHAQAVVTWQGRLLGHLEKHRRYPRQARRLRQQGVTHVRFSVDRQGRVSHPHIGRSSGHLLLDEETLATVTRASPVPPPPPDIGGDPVEVMVPVSFFIRRR